MNTLLRKIETRAKTRFFCSLSESFQKKNFPKKKFLKRPVLTTSFRKFLIKPKTFSGVMSKNNEKLLKFCREKNFKTALWTGRINFDEHAEIKTFDRRGEFFFRVISEKQEFFSRGKLPEVFLLRRSRMEFWQACGRFFARSRSFFLSTS